MFLSVLALFVEYVAVLCLYVTVERFDIAAASLSVFFYCVGRVDISQYAVGILFGSGCRYQRRQFGTVYAFCAVRVGNCRFSVGYGLECLYFQPCPFIYGVYGDIAEAVKVGGGVVFPGERYIAGEFFFVENRTNVSAYQQPYRCVPFGK